MTASRRHDLLGLIYDAPFSPDLWVPTMELLADELSAGSACMTELDILTGEGGGRAARVPEDTMATYASHWANDNPLLSVADPAAYVAGWKLAIIRHEEWLDLGTLHRSGYFNEFLRPLGSEEGMMIRLSLTGTTVSTMNIARPARRGRFDDEEVAHARRWQAHLVRADRIGRQLRLDRAALDAVDRLVATTTQHLFFLDARGRVRRMSVAAEAALADDGPLRLEAARLAARNPAGDARLQRLIASATGRDGGERRGGSTLVTAAPDRPVEVSVTPLGPRSVASWSDEPVALVALDGEHARLPSEPLLRARYGLTPAEARLALALAEGHRLAEIAERSALSVNTVRTQLGTIFSKTGCRRQAELVRLLLATDRAAAND